MLDLEELPAPNCGQPETGASGRGASDGGLTVDRVAFLNALHVDPGVERLEAPAVAKLLRCSERTARRRLAEWHRAPPDTAPATKLLWDFRRRGRSSYFTTRSELARYYPEIDDG